MENLLKCYLSSDLLPWERLTLTAFLNGLSQDTSVEILEIDASQRKALRSANGETIWIVARDWRKAIRYLGVKNRSKSRIFVSVMELASPRENIYKVLLNKFVGPVPESVTLLVHSPLNYRFFTELEGFLNSRVRFLPLPLPTAFQATRTKVPSDFSVGTFGPFISDSHLNYIVSVAHYLVTKNDKIRFRILGTGPLYGHISQMLQDLSIGERVSVAETVDPQLVGDLDTLLYAPLRNDHFLPLYFAGMAGLPVVASEVPGIGDYIKDGHSGFLVSVNETKTMGELVLRIASDSNLASSMGHRLQEILTQTVGAEKLTANYLSTFHLNPQQAKTKDAERAA